MLECAAKFQAGAGRISSGARGHSCRLSAEQIPGIAAYVPGVREPSSI